MHVCIHKVHWIHRRQGAKAPKKNFILSGKGQSSIWTFTIIIYLIFTESTKVHNTQHLRLVMVTGMLRCHDNGNVVLHV